MEPLDPDLVRLAIALVGWNAYVHYDLTKRWALEEGFSDAEAEEVAYWDLWTDRLFPGNRRRTKRFHFSRHGASECADRYLARALAEGRLGYLGIALHCAQDVVAHGPIGHLVHTPLMDWWPRRRARIRERTEAESRRLLRAFRDGGPEG